MRCLNQPLAVATLALALVVAGLLQAPLAVADPALEARLTRLERMLGEQALSDLVLQIQRLQQEVAELRGQVEMQQYQLRQRGLDAPRFGAAPTSDPRTSDTGDIDAGGIDASGPLLPRPLPLDGQSADGLGQDRATPPGGAGPIDGAMPSLRSGGLLGLPPPEAGPDRPGRSGLLGLPAPETLAGGEREAYRSAFEDLKQRDYAAAKQGFETLLGRYPEGQFAESARYWLGEIGYVTQDYPAALAQFNRLITDFPNSSKVPTALLKVGYIHFDRKDLQSARDVLQEVVTRYPDSTEASLARGRLERMGRD